MRFKILTILLVLAALAGGQAQAVEFTAVLFSIHPNGEVYPQDTLTPNFWYRNGAYRYEGNYQERPIVIISDKENDKAWFLDVPKKTYLEVTRSEGGVPDPIAMWDAFFAELKQESLGRQKIRGYDCRKYKYTADNGVWSLQWISDYLGLYIKQITHYSENAQTALELVNIKEQPVDSSLFELPEDYVDVRTLPKEESEQKPKMIKIPARKNSRP